MQWSMATRCLKEDRAPEEYLTCEGRNPCSQVQKVHKHKAHARAVLGLASSLFGQVETREAFNFPFVFHMGRVRLCGFDW